MKDLLKRYIEETRDGKSIRILDRRSPDFAYQKWAMQNGSTVREKLGLEPAGLTIQRFPLGGKE